MKKAKLIPAILMLVLCVGILAIGIYAINPTQNTITGSIAVNSANAEVKLELFVNDSTTATQTFDSVRSGATFNKLSLEFDTSTANEVADVPSVSYTVRITNLSDRSLGAYFKDNRENAAALPADGIALAENIMNETEVNSTLAPTQKVADVLLEGYTYIPATETPIDMEVTFYMSQFFEGENEGKGEGEFTYILNIEPYQTNRVYDENAYEGNGGYIYNTSLVKLPEEGSESNVSFSQYDAFNDFKNVAVPPNIKTSDTRFPAKTLNLMGNPGFRFDVGVSTDMVLGGMYANGLRSFKQGNYRYKDGTVTLLPNTGTTCSAINSNYSFSNVNHLKFAEGITTISLGGSGALMGCLVSKITLPSTLTSAVGASFQLEGNVTLANLKTVIGEFSGTGWHFKDGHLTLTSEIGETFSGLGDMTGLQGLVLDEIIVLPDSVTAISDNGCAYFGHVKDIVLPDSLVSIGHNAFMLCHSLKSIYIPDSVQTISGSILQTATNPTFYCEANTKPENWSSNWNNNGWVGEECPVVWSTARPA